MDLSNKEAANILTLILNNVKYPRGYGKTMALLQYQLALAKAIKVLEKTPD